MPESLAEFVERMSERFVDTILRFRCKDNTISEVYYLTEVENFLENLINEMLEEKVLFAGVTLRKTIGLGGECFLDMTKDKSIWLRAPYGIKLLTHNPKLTFRSEGNSLKECLCKLGDNGEIGHDYQKELDLLYDLVANLIHARHKEVTEC